jgi:hypothetical protein
VLVVVAQHLSGVDPRSGQSTVRGDEPAIRRVPGAIGEAVGFLILAGGRTNGVVRPVALEVLSVAVEGA